jgi:hypothetical protein
MGGGPLDLGGGGPEVFLFVLAAKILGGILFYIRITVFSQSSSTVIYLK